MIIDNTENMVVTEHNEILRQREIERKNNIAADWKNCFEETRRNQSLNTMKKQAVDELDKFEQAETLRHDGMLKQKQDQNNQNRMDMTYQFAQENRKMMEQKKLEKQNDLRSDQ